MAKKRLCAVSAPTGVPWACTLQKPHEGQDHEARGPFTPEHPAGQVMATWPNEQK